MVTLQILVLSFLVRIQVAQLKRLSKECRFFVLCLRFLARGCSVAVTVGLRNLPIAASIIPNHLATNAK